MISLGLVYLYCNVLWIGGELNAFPVDDGIISGENQKNAKKTSTSFTNGKDSFDDYSLKEAGETRLVMKEKHKLVAVESPEPTDPYHLVGVSLEVIMVEEDRNISSKAQGESMAAHNLLKPQPSPSPSQPSSENAVQTMYKDVTRKCQQAFSKKSQQHYQEFCAVIARHCDHPRYMEICSKLLDFRPRMITTHPTDTILKEPSMKNGKEMKIDFILQKTTITTDATSQEDLSLDSDIESKTGSSKVVDKLLTNPTKISSKGRTLPSTSSTVGADTTCNYPCNWMLTTNGAVVRVCRFHHRRRQYCEDYDIYHV